MLKIFKVEFEMLLGKCNLMKRLENIWQARSNKRVEFKKEKTRVKSFSNDAKSEGRTNNEFWQGSCAVKNKNIFLLWELNSNFM